MEPFDIPVWGVDTDAYEEFILTERAPPECMAISDLDGFLTALAIGPELIMPSEWMPVVWGGCEPQFADAEEAQAVLGGIMSLYNCIVYDVECGMPQPHFYISIEKYVIASDWAEGFMDAVRLRWQAWQPFIESEKGFLVLAPILALCSDEKGEWIFGFDEKDETEITQKAAELIPSSIIDIADYWRPDRPRRDPEGMGHA
jgi:uncharacterized protein